MEKNINSWYVNAKNFLRPNSKKFILSIILFVVFLFGFQYIPNEYFFLILFFPFVILVQHFEKFFYYIGIYDYLIDYINYFYIIILFFFFYLASCIIFLFYDKRNKLKNKKYQAVLILAILFFIPKPCGHGATVGTSMVCSCLGIIMPQPSTSFGGVGHAYCCGICLVCVDKLESRDAFKNYACTKYVQQQNCGDNPASVTIDYDVNSDKNKTNDNLEDFLKIYYGCDSSDAAQVLLCIRRTCACPDY